MKHWIIPLSLWGMAGFVQEAVASTGAIRPIETAEKQTSNKQMKDKVIEAISNLRNEGYSCSQATLLGLAKAMGSELTEKQLMAMSAGFRGGIGKTYDDGTCGALNAGIMALGLYLSDENDTAIELSKTLFEHFKKSQGTVICGEFVKKHNGFSKCTGCCLCVGEKVAELLETANTHNIAMFEWEK